MIKVQEQGSQISIGTNIKEGFRASRQWYNLDDGMGGRDKIHLDKYILTSIKIKEILC